MFTPPPPLTSVGALSLEMLRTREFLAFLKDCGGEGPAREACRGRESELVEFGGEDGAKLRGLESRFPNW